MVKTTQAQKHEERPNAIRSSAACLKIHHAIERNDGNRRRRLFETKKFFILGANLLEPSSKYSMEFQWQKRR